jgi:hypothetical protein
VRNTQYRLTYTGALMRLNDSGQWEYVQKNSRWPRKPVRALRVDDYGYVCRLNGSVWERVKDEDDLWEPA